MNAPTRAVGDFAARARRAAAGSLRRIRDDYSPARFMVGTVLVLGVLLIVTAFVLIQYFGKDVLTSLTFNAQDGYCRRELRESVGVHCFGDYSFVLHFTSQPNPWDYHLSFFFNYPAAGLLPHWLFGEIGILSGRRDAGLFGYLLAMVAALAAPAVWAGAAKTLTTRIIVVAGFGLLAVPAISALDRGNSIAFAVPALLVFLVALRRGRYTTVVIAIIIATMVKPQFVLLIVALFAARKWKQGLLALAGVAVTNVIPYLLWPTDFPGTIIQSLGNTLTYGTSAPLEDQFPVNVSFAKGLYLAETAARGLVGLPARGGVIEAHAALASAIPVILVMAALLVLGRRIPAHIGGILLIVSAALVASTSYSYYLVVVLPIAAVLLRDPLSDPSRERWNGILETRSSRAQTIASVILVVAVAASVSRVIIPRGIAIPRGVTANLVQSSAELTPLLWLAAFAGVIVAWALPRETTAARAVASANASRDETADTVR